jgi:hypothetical protein
VLQWQRAFVPALRAIGQATRPQWVAVSRSHFLSSNSRADRTPVGRSGTVLIENCTVMQIKIRTSIIGTVLQAADVDMTGFCFA